MRIVQKLVAIILDLIIFIISVLVIIAGIYAVQTRILKKETAEIFGYTAFEVVTGSMSGTIEIGDLIIVKVTNDVKINDIIVYKDGTNFITHRVIDEKGTEIITKGDANNSQDVPINASQVFGKVELTIPKVGIWKKVLTTPSVLIAIVITIILLTILVYTKPKSTKEK